MKNRFTLSLLVSGLLFLLGGVSSAAAEQVGADQQDALSSQSPSELFDQANAVFEKGNKTALKNPAQAKDLYQEAILKYRFLVDSKKGISPELYANLANAYFFVGDHGRAVLYYHRALDLDPLNADIRHSLNYVRSLTVDELPKTKTEQVLHALTFWHRWPFGVRLALFVIGNVLFWGGVARLLYRRNRWDVWVIALSFLLALVFGVSLLCSYLGWGDRVDGVVLAREVVARQGNGYIYDNAYTSSVHAGTEFELIETRDGWYHARLLDGSTCWLPKKSSALIR